ncbi:tyrosine-type recombinase/integrase [Streptomyces sp. NPDC008079]|uniref:tyrosine-type recombinase/integrase n=1 Tax=Streptomyces sp. NPDC008079 TaxID=3364806 RepID=UPI0036F0A02D
MDPRTALEQWLADGNPDRRGATGRVLADKSTDGYENDVTSWLDFLDLVRINAWEADGSHVKTWLDSTGHAVRSRARHVSALSAFYAYAQHFGYCGHSPAYAALRGRPQDEPGLDLLTAAQTAAVRAAADALTTPTAARDRLMIYLMLAQLRPRQITELGLSDLHFEQHRLTADVWQKGGGTRLTELPAAVTRVLTVYLPHRVFRPPHSHEASGPVLTTYRGNALDPNITPRTVLRAAVIASPACTAARVPRDLKPDALAHSPSPLAG